MDLMQSDTTIERILNGERDLYAEIIRAHQDMVFRTCIGFTHNSEDAEDLTQEVFISVYQQLNRFKGDSKISTWLYRIAVNASLNHVRNTKKRNIFQRIESIFIKGKHDEHQTYGHASENPEHLLIASQENAAIKDAIDSLPQNQRVAFTLSKYDELSQSEIAAIMSLSEGAVEQLLQRAKVSLRKKLAPFYKK